MGNSTYQDTGKEVLINTEEGILKVIPLNDRSVRVIFKKEDIDYSIEDLIYTNKKRTPAYRISDNEKTIHVILERIIVVFDKASTALTFTDKKGKILLKEVFNGRKIIEDTLDSRRIYNVTQRFYSPNDEYLFGTGQFQDGYLNIRGLTRRLTQVNSQISVPFVLSNKGYGLLWNNYGLTHWNPAKNRLKLKRDENRSKSITVDATGTSGNKREKRQMNRFLGSLELPKEGNYALMLDVGQSMARKHHLVIDGDTLVHVNNIWLPPTTSLITKLTKGAHEIIVEGEEHDSPILYWREVTDETVLSSPIAEAIDYTVFAGSGDETIASYRELTGNSPMLPLWAFGYIHCRERYNSQEELLENARTFRERGIPLDLIVQDWQYWGKYGWNAMQFDEERYPNPKEMVKKLHEINMRLMVSVWSKIDKQSQVGKDMESKGYYIPGSDWIDFFNPKAAEAYWKHFSERLLPIGIDGWWLDATEPENDDLQNRRIMNGTLPGELLRNVYPLYVNKTVYEGFRKDDPEKRRAFILTRSGFSGIQRYATVTWTGDVGHDWETLRRQITAGLGQMSAGLPWWTYDAGGFFRPSDQYSNPDYHELFIRWFQAGSFFPVLRVHGYMSNTEPWRYGEKVEQIIKQSLNLRYRLLPYIYSEASRVSFYGSTLMRPLVMDFPDDQIALSQNHQFMFGPSILVAPITEPGVKEWSVYLPNNKQGWVDYRTGILYKGGQSLQVPSTLSAIPLFVKAGSIIPFGPAKQSTSEVTNTPLEIYIYPGEDASFTLYEDEGNNYKYESGEYSTIEFNWNDKESTLTIENRTGSYSGMKTDRLFLVKFLRPSYKSDIGKDEIMKVVKYNGKKKNIRFNQ